MAFLKYTVGIHASIASFGANHPAEGVQVRFTMSESSGDNDNDEDEEDEDDQGSSDVRTAFSMAPGCCNLKQFLNDKLTMEFFVMVDAETTNEIGWNAIFYALRDGQSRWWVACSSSSPQRVD